MSHQQSASFSGATAAKNLEVLNSNDSFLQIRRYDELKIGKRYRVVGTDMKKGKYGKRCVLVLHDDEREEEENFLFFLSQSYADAKKASALEALARNKSLYFKIEKVSEVFEIIHFFLNFLIF